MQLLGKAEAINTHGQRDDVRVNLASVSTELLLIGWALGYAL
jgi:hypothetical protein